MSKFRKLSVSSFKGDNGWKLRDTYNDLIKDIERYSRFFCIMYDFSTRSFFHITTERTLFNITLMQDRITNSIGVAKFHSRRFKNQVERTFTGTFSVYHEIVVHNYLEMRKDV